MSEVQTTTRQRYGGVWSVRHSVARKRYDCLECGYDIRPGEHYWRYYGKLGEAFKPWMARMCVRCQERWQERYGDVA